jgi:ABC-type Fe3+ transport system permease subunit
LRWLYVVLAVAIVAVPLGLLAPGTAWGEWNSQQLASQGLSAIPQGLAQLENLWSAPLSGYDLPALGNSNVGYILSAVVGIIVIAVVAWLLTTLLTARKPNTSGKSS